MASLSLWERYASYLLPLLVVFVDYAAVVAAELLSYQLRRHWLPIADPHFYIPDI